MTCKYVLKQWLYLFRITKNNLEFMGASNEKFIAPIKEKPLLDFVTQPRTEVEIKGWLVHNQQHWNFDALFNSGLITEIFIDKDHINAPNHSFYSAIGGKDFDALIKSKTILIIGEGSISQNLIYLLAKSEIGKVILVSEGRVSQQDISTQALYDFSDFNKLKSEIIPEKVSKFSHTKVVVYSEKISKELLEKISNEHSIDLVITNTLASVNEKLLTYNLFTKIKSTPTLNVGFLNCIILLGPLLIKESKYYEEQLLIHSDFKFSSLEKETISPIPFASAILAANQTWFEILKFWMNNLDYKAETLDAVLNIDVLTSHRHITSLPKEEICSTQSDLLFVQNKSDDKKRI